MEGIGRFLRKGILEVEPFGVDAPVEEIKGKRGLSKLTQMATNENPLGPSPEAVEAMRRELRKTHRYPEGPCTALQRKLAQRLGIDPHMISFGNGADNCISMVGSAFIDEGDEVVMAAPTFFLYAKTTRIMGGKPVIVPLKNEVHDLQAMAERIGPHTKLVFICNPNNPTGSIVGGKELDGFIRSLPAHVLLILDEAYREYASEKTFPDGLNYIKSDFPVLSLRTFSKLYGLAGLRIGYALGPKELVAALNRVREPFPVCRPAQAAAMAALDDRAFVNRVLKSNQEGKAYLYQELEKLGLSYVPSHTNFIFVNLKTDAQAVFEVLLGRGILVRPGHSWERPSWARVTIGTMKQNKRFIEELKAALSGRERHTQ